MPGNNRTNQDNGTTADHIRPSSVPAKAWGRVLLALCLIQFAVLVALTVVYRETLFATSNLAQRLAARRNPQEPLFYGGPGPWGEMKYVRITIEPPDEFVPIDDRVFAKTRWHFSGYQRDRLAILFNAPELTPEQRAELLNAEAWNETTNGIVVTPSERLVLGLSPAARTRIYSVLAENEMNDFHCWPFTFRPGGFDAWFQKSGLNDANLDLVRRLTYSRGQSLCFSDLPQVFEQMPAIPERRRLWKTLSRHASLLMKLQIHHDSDVEALTSYWAKGGRAKDIQPLLESLTKVPGGITIDIAQLLPPFARKRLNSYPFPPSESSGPAPDCFWTSFNFFNEPPNEQFLDPAVWLAELHTNYVTVTNAMFGDLVFLLRPDDTPLHAAVYIADDVVFTKNGGNYRQPWILMERDDLIACYPQNYTPRTVTFRSKRNLH